MDPRKKPEINISAFRRVYPFSQAAMVTGTPHAGGVCSASTSLFLRSLLANRSIAPFTAPNYRTLLPTLAAEEKRIIAHGRDGNDPDRYAFDRSGHPSSVAVVSPARVSAVLDEKADAANITYNTSSGTPHSVAFFRDPRRCMMQDANRFTAEATPAEHTGSCSETTDVIQKIIERSDPRVVKIAYKPRTPGSSGP